MHQPLSWLPCLFLAYSQSPRRMLQGRVSVLSAIATADQLMDWMHVAHIGAARST